MGEVLWVLLSVLWLCHVARAFVTRFNLYFSYLRALQYYLLGRFAILSFWTVWVIARLFWGLLARPCRVAIECIRLARVWLIAVNDQCIGNRCTNLLLDWHFRWLLVLNWQRICTVLRRGHHRKNNRKVHDSLSTSSLNQVLPKNHLRFKFL